MQITTPPPECGRREHGLTMCAYRSSHHFSTIGISNEIVYLSAASRGLVTLPRWFLLSSLWGGNSWKLVEDLKTCTSNLPFAYFFRRYMKFRPHLNLKNGLKTSFSPTSLYTVTECVNCFRKNGRNVGMNPVREACFYSLMGIFHEPIPKISER
jgi:hypothetical protein